MARRVRVAWFRRNWGDIAPHHKKFSDQEKYPRSVMPARFLRGELLSVNARSESSAQLADGVSMSTGVELQIVNPWV